MPQIVSDNHHKFWNKFNDNGLPYFLDKKRHLFAKKSDGYIMPLMVYVKFVYDKEYGHVFLVVINLVPEMQPFLNQQKYNPAELMILMTDNEDRIVEIN